MELGTIIDYAHHKLIYTDENGNKIADVDIDDKLITGLNKDVDAVLGSDIPDDLTFNVNNEPLIHAKPVFDSEMISSSGQYYPGYYNHYDGFAVDPDPVDADGDGVG